MTHGKGIDEIIRAAMERGEFDNLPGQGKPVDLSAYFETPEEVRVAHALLKGADVVAPEVELLQEIAALKEKRQTAVPDEQDALDRKIRDLQLKLDLMLDRLRQQRRGR